MTTPGPRNLQEVHLFEARVPHEGVGADILLQPEAQVDARFLMAALTYR